MERFLCQYSSTKSSVLQIYTICFAKTLDFKTNAKWFANTKLYLRENAEVWTNICIVCYNCETHLPFYEETALFSHTCAGSFSHTHARRFCYVHLNGFLFQKQQMAMLVNLCKSPETWNTSLHFQTNVSGEQVSFCLTISIIIHLDVFTKWPYRRSQKQQ